MEKQVEEYRLRPFANMLDAGGATAAAYQVPKNSVVWIVVVDPEGKIAFNDPRGMFYSSGPNQGKLVYHLRIDESLKKSPGILGIQDVPAELGPAAHFFDLQQFGPLEIELKKAEARGNAAAKEFAAQVRARMAETRKARAEQIKAMVQSEPLQAYREAESFVAAFPTSPEKAAVSQLARDAAKDPAVKKELQAEEAYQKMIVPEMTRTRTHKAFTQKIQPLLDAYMKKYGDTQYSKAVKESVDAYGKALLLNE
jgi:hypothetical protein